MHESVIVGHLGCMEDLREDCDVIPDVRWQRARHLGVIQTDPFPLELIRGVLEWCHGTHSPQGRSQDSITAAHPVLMLGGLLEPVTQSPAGE